MSELKTKPTSKPVAAFIESVAPQWKQEDSQALIYLMEKITGEKPVMWGNAIIGFGNYHYRYKSGREGDWFLSGFSPRKQNMTIYMMSGFEGRDELLDPLGKHKKSVGCLYFKRLEDIKMEILEELITKSVDAIKKKYTANN